MTARMTRLVTSGAAAVILAAAIGGSAFAQSAPAATPTKGQGQQRDARIDALAARLGKTPAELRAAIVAVEKERIAQALQSGRLTHEQANRLTQRVEQRGELLGGHLGKKQDGKDRGDAKAARSIDGLAQFLGSSARDLKAELGTGKTLAQVAQARGKSRDDLKTYITAQTRTRLATAVQSGRLTQQKADQMLKKLTDHLDQLLDRPGHAKKQPGADRGRRA